ncbi:C25 family cysteine peptidase [Flammeovirgaceae bacterium SG7u.111]|nr:C25 family cysteine peptidase [Flammeovirgaceae bacterium SG7u.132]WPO34608.1 C25 family cysteine peptidase [Flammeovirgaceae bacterium SG7u.111]
MNRNKKKHLAWLLLLISSSLFAQDFNSWINFSQDYFKVGVKQDGIYRLTYTELDNAGFPISTINPKNIQLFHRGKEMAIVVSGQADGIFNESDYIEFYGQKNDGTTDKFMYEDENGQTNPFYNLYSDESFYFLTYSLDESEGKRIEEINQDPTGLTIVPYHLQERVYHWSNNFSGGPLYPTFIQSIQNQGALLSTFTQGKGYTGQYRGGSYKENNVFYLDNYTTSGVVPHLEVNMTGRSNTPHVVEILVGVDPANQRSVGFINFSQYENGLFSVDLRHDDLPTDADSVFISYQISQVTSLNEIVSLSYIKLTYPQLTDAGEAARKALTILPQSEANVRLEIDNVLPDTRAWDITDIYSIRSLVSDYDDASKQLTLAFPGFSSANGKLALETATKSVNSISKADMSPIRPEQFDYYIIYHPNVSGSSGDYENVPFDYAAYRSSEQGGSYEATAVDINNIYNQFTYGEVNPLAIRRFADYTLQNGKPKFLLIAGKGLELTQQYERYKPSSEAWSYQSLIPPYGFPGSDNAYSSGLKGSVGDEPAIPTGRISAINATQLASYLNKVIEYELPENFGMWKKNVLHLSGGISIEEHEELKGYMDSLEDIIIGDYWGAKVKHIVKATTENVEFIDVTQEVNDGVGLMTFIGHSSTSTTDIEIGYCSNSVLGFKNQGKYPFMFLNGCNSGNVFTTSRSLGEDWILTPDKGAIGYIAHVYLGFASVQFNYTNYFYQAAFANKALVDKPVGVIMQQAIKAYRAKYSSSELAEANAQQFLLQGDPAVRLFPSYLPDYMVDESSVFAKSFDIEEKLSAQSDSIQLGISVTNLGITDGNDFTVSVSRTFSDGSTKVYDPQTYSAVVYRDTLYYTVRVSEEEKLISGGNNLFQVSIDASNAVDEMDENNNTAMLNLFLPKNNMIILTPSPFSIVGRKNIEFLAQNADPLSPDRFYTFQVDTSSNFNSPLLTETSVFAGLTPEWATALPGENNIADSTVFYWRTRYSDISNAEDSLWTESSFTFINEGPNGWSQTKAAQFDKNKLNKLEAFGDREWGFVKTNLKLEVKSVGGAVTDWQDHYIKLNDFEVVVNGECARNRLIMMFINKETGLPYPLPSYDPPGEMGDIQFYSCGFGEPGFAAFLRNSSSANGKDFVYSEVFHIFLNTMNEGDYVVFITSGQYNFSNLRDRHLEALEMVGIDGNNLRNVINNGDPYIALGVKGAAPGTAQEFLPRYTSGTPSNAQKIEHTFNLNLEASSGDIATPRIGPSKQWDQLYLVSKEEENHDKWQVDLVGVNQQGIEQILLSDVDEGLTEIGFIDAAQYPYLKLVANTEDSVNKTPVQLYDWKVIFEQVPEGVLYYADNAPTDQIPYYEEGDTTRFSYTFKNVTGSTFSDSLIIRYTLQNQTTNKQSTFYDTLNSLAAFDSLKFSVELDTREWVGQNKLNIYVNPRVQAEQVYENNILESFYQVGRDSTNPVLDVVFDGQHIMNGDIVSPSPMITVSLKDENKYLVREDTLGVDLFMTTCDSCELIRIPFSDPTINWSQVGENDFQVYYQPDQLTDGNYTFMVQGADVIGNKAGVKPYKVSFEVITESKITHFYPYPNPFSDNVRFVFTLTGTEIPDELKIQIMTVSGRVVREITQDEIGALRIGNNMTQYAWDGKDEYGDQLANGVYLYRVITQMNGQQMDHRETSGDKYFKEGFGKMYLMK